MNDRSFAALPRRPSLAILSAAGLVTLTANVTAAKNKRNRKNSKNDDKAKKKCKTQIGQCTDLIALRCSAEPEVCTAALECCDFAGRCDFAGFLNCLLVVGA